MASRSTFLHLPYTGSDAWLWPLGSDGIEPGAKVYGLRRSGKGCAKKSE